MLTVTLILIIAAFAVFAALQRIHINNLNAKIDREQAMHEVTNELLTEARNEAKVEADLRRQAEKNLSVEADHAEYWADLTKEWYSEHCKESDRANKAEAALAKYSRPRDPKTGRFYSTKAKPSTLIETDGVTARIVPNPHTLRHGMTVKDPTPEQAREIFDEAKRLGIESYESNGNVSKEYPWVWYVDDDGFLSGISDCVGVEFGSEVFVNPSQFLAHMRGEDYALAAFDAMMGNAIEQLQGLTVRNLCDEVKDNAGKGI